MAQQNQLQLGRWVSRASVGSGISAVTKSVIAAAGYRHGFSSIGETVELGILGGVTGAIWPYVREGFRRTYRNSISAFRDNPMTLRTIANNIRGDIGYSIASGYLFETLVSLATSPPVHSLGEFIDHMETHATRGALEGLAFGAVPFLAYGVRRGIAEPTYNYLHARGWI